MSEYSPKSDIDYSITREVPRATFEFPKTFDQDFYSYEDVFENELLIAQQPYELNEYSPTPLDPFHLKLHRTDYFTSSGHYMDGRLTVAADKIGLADIHREIIANEINHEHLLRSNKNNEAMKRIRKSVDHSQPVDRMTAELVLKARAGVITLEEAAYLLAAFPEADSIEVLKYTGPLIDDLVSLPTKNGKEIVIGTKFDAAHFEFMSSLHLIGQTSSGIVVDSSAREAQRPRNSDGYGITNIIATKGKDSDLYVKGTEMELVGRYSYYVPGVTDDGLAKIKPTIAMIHNKPVAMYRIALSKYLRIAKTNGHQE